MRLIILLAAALGFTLGCGDNGTGPGPAPDRDGARLAGQLDGLADSVDAGGYSPAAEALRHAAEIVRLTGHATSVRLSVDGVAKDFLGVGEQIRLSQPGVHLAYRQRRRSTTGFHRCSALRHDRRVPTATTRFNRLSADR